jgi:hypothetical protein
VADVVDEPSAADVVEPSEADVVEPWVLDAAEPSWTPLSVAEDKVVTSSSNPGRVGKTGTAGGAPHS